MYEIQSTDISELAKALCAAQAVMCGALKDTNNTFFKSKYATLESVWDACRKPLSDNGLSVAQTTTVSVDDSAVIVNTRLMHSSGQWLLGELRMKPVKNDPQGIGSCITYARRYALAAMVGVYQTDDDGNEASGNQTEPSTEKSYISKTPTPSKTNWVQKDGCISEAQSRLIYARRKKAGKISDAEWMSMLSASGYADVNEIPKSKLENVIAAVE